MIRCVFFDRDGIVNESPGPARYVTRWDDFHLMPEFPECLRVVTEQGYQAIVISNQRCVARGLVSAETIDDIHRRLQDLLRRQYQVQFLDITYCPHDNGVCTCRKPQPGMLLTMAEKHAIDLHASWMVGNSETDIEAGQAAGCRTVLIGPMQASSRADIRVPSMRKLPDTLRQILAV